MSAGWRQYAEQASSRIASAIGILKLIAVPPTQIKEIVMARVIEFYIPKNFRKSLKVITELQRGKVIEFSQTKKSF